jgi:hypothetical protein
MPRRLNQYGEYIRPHVTKAGPQRRLKLFSWVIFGTAYRSKDWKSMQVIAYSLHQARQKVANDFFYHEYYPDLCKIVAEEYPLDVDTTETPPQVWH